ncbi:hypothetical protein AL755_09380 [Arthrobacter sp. ERGS1:01]|uniref:hypothetical protein n=1 Tax=Arthrobacter sp. ERGS1:01 TaxID=1704044 RepID=UPI0006B45BA0|nr:hypothetical protein [Arthrobacter sp. ERGS1:01]ALE05643.1 hypothetical protein AL755_09380 [Arthrobacter sp. ERGS1:01]
MEIQDVWQGLDPKSQDWFRQNPGCRALPRTLVNIISTGYAGHIKVDQDGIMPLTEKDLKFLHDFGRGPADHRQM